MKAKQGTGPTPEHPNPRMGLFRDPRGPVSTDNSWRPAQAQQVGRWTGREEKVA